MLSAPLIEAAPKPLRRRIGGQRGGTDRFAKERADVLWSRLRQALVELGQGGLAARIKAPSRRRDVEVRGQIGLVWMDHRSTPGQRERRHRGTVICLRG